MNNNEYRLMPVALLPAIRDALVETGKCFQPEHVWAAIIEAFDRVAAPERSETPADAVGLSIKTWQERRDEDIKLNGEAQADRFAYAAYEIADLRAALAVSSSAAPSEGVPEHLREFVEAIAYTYDRADGDDESVCLGCSGLIEHDAGANKEYAHHRPDCIVLRAQAALATPSVQGVAAAGQEWTDAERVFEIAFPYFAWNAPDWRKATEGTITMTSLLSFVRAIEEYRHLAAPAASPVELTDAPHSAVTPMFLLNAAFCIESPHEVPTSRKREVLASLHRVADEMQAARMAAKRSGDTPALPGEG